MKIYISCDMEGVAGISDWQQVSPGSEFELGRRLLLEEVNAAIDGAMEAGASAFVVNDSHGSMHNLPPDELHGRAEYLSGRHKPMYMMEGLDESFDAVFFIGYHGAVDGPASALSHTYNPAAVAAATINGARVGEGGINALVAAHFRVPVALVTGDRHTAAQTAPFCPGATLVVVKESITRFAAQSLHPKTARERIHAAATGCLTGLGAVSYPKFPTGVHLRLTLRNADLAELAAAVRGVTRDGDTTVLVEGETTLTVFRSFVAVLQITRGLAQEH
ncbi:MAG TPA: M55 family metallopeptidase [Candidatus Dormibacteraeota bacterium]|nr:M55 family metallopeptidase [Candidatus Dormibacteraeota bacterium]